MEMTNILLEDQNALLQLLITMVSVNAGILVVIAFFIARGNK